MISICIGIYNWDVSNLIFDLADSLKGISVPYEILLLDDASDEYYHGLNSRHATLPHVFYRRNEVNAGRAAVRNRLAAWAQFPYLLFMDCDAALVSTHYVQNYVQHLPADVLVGGTVYAPQPPAKEKLLRWKYGRERETHAARERNQHPNTSFTPFNFLISKELFSKIQFDEKLTGYGHEDTLFGLQLLEQGIAIRHIDNPLQHDGLNDTEHYLQQLDNACHNLLLISDNETVTQNSRLLLTYKKLKTWHLANICSCTLSLLKPFIVANLKSAHPRMFLLDLYKLSSLLRHAQKPRK